MIDRKLIVEIAVMLAVCVGAWMMIVQPHKTELQALNAKIRDAKHHPARLNKDMIEAMAAQLDEIRAEVREIDEQNRFGRETSQMYGLIMGLAKEHDVTVQRLDPGTGRADEGTAVEISSFHMSVEGKYRQVAAFLDDIVEIDGFVRPGSMNLTPRGMEGDAMVAAQFSCEALSFGLPEALTALAALAGENDADE